MPTISSIVGFDSAPLVAALAKIREPKLTGADRDATRKLVERICETQVIPNLDKVGAPELPSSEPVLAEVVLGSRAPSYLRRVVQQANGCYERRWFDACSVMIRKLVEGLIIEVYEKHGKQSEIQKPNADYLMLSDLVSAILNQTHWTLGRESRQVLPDLKRLGDRAAHNRRYMAGRQDVDNLRTGLRALADDLAHLAGYK